MSARTKKTRLNVRIPSDLLKWIKKYAKDRNTTVTQLVVLHFMNTKSKTLLHVPFDPNHMPPGTNITKEASHG